MSWLRAIFVIRNNKSKGTVGGITVKEVGNKNKITTVAALISMRITSAAGYIEALFYDKPSVLFCSMQFK